MGNAHSYVYNFFSTLYDPNFTHPNDLTKFQYKTGHFLFVLEKLFFVFFFTRSDIASSTRIRLAKNLLSFMRIDLWSGSPMAYFITFSQKINRKSIYEIK